ncbi:sensor histidine kinase [Jiangella alkaliphila]|uniref:histidine kinase n=1 Tax=Jiangella alkaliphila TaxID=419479 RepID=A0A1H2I3C2_9ACTN|nr:ATP-binding protein [Jiangella alkaliphila]SDU38640.1 two-component system, OmpR family, sensor histidine kinase BaeS [Jiangella alkaliphila]
MRRSLFVRLLVLFLGVAIISIAGTAWLTTQSTSQRLRGEFESTLEADSDVYGALAAYAQNHDSWDGVGPLVDELAERTGNRVAVTDPGGEVLADSAASGGGAPPLPSTPTAEIDPMAPLAVMDGGFAMTAAAPMAIEGWAGGGGVAREDAPSADASPEPGSETAPPDELISLQGTSAELSVVSGPMATPLDWRLTEEEAKTRERLVAEANACLQQLGTDGLFVSPDGTVLRTSSDPVGTVLEKPQETIDVAPVDTSVRECVPKELSLASEASQALNSEQARLTEECLTAAGVAAAPTFSPETGLIQLSVDSTDATALAALADCSVQAGEQAMEPFLADPALLYIGSTDRFDAFTGDGWVRTALTGLGVLAAATGVTVFAGRRLSHPIRTLTDAAQRLAAGARGTRVKVTGRDEVAALGHAFNAMASSIEANERQRKAMVSDIAHELRTPLANVRGYLEAAEDGVVAMDAQLVTSLLEESTLLQRLIDDLQDLALADAGMLRVHREDTDVAELARQVVAAHQPSASASSVELVVAAPSTVVADADPVRLRQALGNLVANAVQYSGSGSTVLVRVSHDVATDEVVLAVRDDGPGIAPEHLEHLFDRFYRTDTSRTRATGGSGLGLAITKHLVEAHDGTVTVSSMVGAGSTFTIRVPVRAAVPAA